VIHGFGDIKLVFVSVPEEIWITLNSLQVLAIVYLAIAVSKLRERIAKMEGLEQGREEGRHR